MHTNPRSLREKLGTHSILWRSVLRSVIITVGIVVILTIVARLLTAAALRERLFEQMASIAAAGEEQMESELSDLRQQTALFASLLEERIALPLSSQERTVLNRSVEEFRSKQANIRLIQLYGTGGTVLWGGGEAVDLPTVAATQIVPRITKSAWDTFDIVSPLQSAEDELTGWILVRYDTSIVIERVFSLARALGETGEAVWGVRHEGDLLMLQAAENQLARTYNMGAAEDWLGRQAPLALAASGQEGIGIFTDVNGNRVVAAYRYLPTLDWGMVFKLNELEAFSTARMLSHALLAVGLALFGFAALFAVFSGRALTKPILELRDKVRKLKPKHWEYERTIHTRDEIELLDTVLTDITGRLRKAYERLEGEVEERTKQLQQSYAKDRVILESITYGLLVLDQNGLVIECNTAATSLLQKEVSDIVRHDAAVLLDLHEQQKPVSKENNPIWKCLGRSEEIRTTPEQHLSLRRSDQTLLPIKLSATPLLQNGELIGAIALFQDVTAERQIDYMKTEFITLASHQLRTPLASMKWYLEFLGTEEQEHLTDEQKSYITELRLASHRMSNVVDELMDVSRLQRGGITPIPQDIECKSLIQGRVDDVKGLAAEHSVQLKTDLPEESVHITSDPMLLSIVLQNILLNAIKYSEKGGQVTISLCKEGENVRVDIADEGLGIPLADHDQIFQKLFRARNVRHREVNGSGLGLYSSKRLVQQLKGTVSFKSKEGKGTTFTIVVPPLPPAPPEQA